jgi:hypothetical protein
LPSFSLTISISLSLARSLILSVYVSLSAPHLCPLASLLQTKSEFTEEEFASFKVDVPANAYIKAGTKYYRPAATLWNALKHAMRFTNMGRYRYFMVDRHYEFTFFELASLGVSKTKVSKPNPSILPLPFSRVPMSIRVSAA